MYVFNVWPHGEDVIIGVTHFTEVAFVFHNIYVAGYNTSVSADPFADQPETYVQVSSMMLSPPHPTGLSVWRVSRDGPWSRAGSAPIVVRTNERTA